MFWGGGLGGEGRFGLDDFGDFVAQTRFLHRGSIIFGFRSGVGVDLGWMSVSISSPRRGFELNVSFFLKGWTSYEIWWTSYGSGVEGLCNRPP